MSVALQDSDQFSCMTDDDRLTVKDQQITCHPSTSVFYTMKSLESRCFEDGMLKHGLIRKLFALCLSFSQQGEQLRIDCQVPCAGRLKLIIRTRQGKTLFAFESEYLHPLASQPRSFLSRCKHWLGLNDTFRLVFRYTNAKQCHLYTI